MKKGKEANGVFYFYIIHLYLVILNNGVLLNRQDGIDRFKAVERTS